MNKVAITGFNAVSPLGLDCDEFARRMLNGESGIQSLEGIVSDPDFPVSCAGLLPKSIFPALEVNDYSGEIKAQLKVLFQNRLIGEFDGLVFGTNHGLAKFADIHKFHSGQRIDFDNLRQDLGITFLLNELKRLGHPPIDPKNVIGLANGCVTGLAAVIYAAQRVNMGLNRRVLVVCDEIRVRPEDLLKYNALGALSREKGPAHKVSRPFSKTRSGFVKGEGAGFVIIENHDAALKRGAKIAATIEGFSLTSDAYRLTDGREDLKGMCAAMEQALARAKVDPSQIDFISAHGTSTPNNDLLETMGIKKVFGSRAYDIPVSSLKSQIGHLNFACGIVELVSCLIMLEHQRVAPTLNFERDPECDLHYVPDRSEARRLNFILKNSFGFGGANSAMVLKAST